MVRGWLDRGVDGFRLDVFNAFLKDAELPSNPSRAGRSPWDRQDHVTTWTSRTCRAPRAVPRDRGRATRADDRRRAVLGHDRRAAELTTRRHLVFDWELLEPALDRDRVPAAIHGASGLRPDGWPTIALSNHDQPRQPPSGRVGRRDGQTGRDRRAAAVLLTLRGTPFMYYGEEIGDARRRHPARRERRSAGRAVAGPTSSGGTVHAAARRCRGGRAGRRVPTGRPWLRFGARRRDPERRRPGRRSGSVLALSAAPAPARARPRSRIGSSSSMRHAGRARLGRAGADGETSSSSISLGRPASGRCRRRHRRSLATARRDAPRPARTSRPPAGPPRRSSRFAAIVATSSVA